MAKPETLFHLFMQISPTRCKTDLFEMNCRPFCWTEFYFIVYDWQTTKQYLLCSSKIFSSTCILERVVEAKVNLMESFYMLLSLDCIFVSASNTLQGAYFRLAEVQVVKP